MHGNHTTQSGGWNHKEHPWLNIEAQGIVVASRCRESRAESSGHHDYSIDELRGASSCPPCCSRLRRLPRFTSRCASEDDCTISTPVSDHLKLDTLSFSWMPLVPLSPPQTQPCQAFRVRQSSTLLQPSVRTHADRLQLLSTSMSAYRDSPRRNCWPSP
jgi:hypothetical protein